MNTFILSDGDLKARVLVPENTHYVRTRFNHAGFVPDVWFGGMKFTQYERNQNDGFPSTDGCGICCDYDGPGFSAGVNPGEKYLKPGIGIITKGERDIGICDWVKYEPLPTRYDALGNKAVFETLSPEVNGYRYAETRTVRLEGDTLYLDCTLKNTGSKPLAFEEYGHNFLSLGDLEVGPGYRLETPSIPDPAALNSLPLAYSLQGDKSGFGFKDEVRKSFYVKTEDVCSAPFTWKMTAAGTSASITGKDSFTPCKIAVWGDYYVLSCEVFIPIRLAPGEQMSWTRSWTFTR